MAATPIDVERACAATGYSRFPVVDAAGDFAGYLTAWCYWITCWAGNAAIVSNPSD